MTKTAYINKFDKPIHRLSVSLSAEQYAELTQIAKKNKVSIDWGVRQGIERLLQDESPLLHVRLPK